MDKLTTIAFIGGGNIARSLIQGLIIANYSPDKILVSDPDIKKLQQLQADFAINITQDNNMAANKAEIIILAVKPQILKQVAQALSLNHNPLIISVAAGIRMADLYHWLGNQQKIIRSMPNTPMALGLGMTILYAKQNTAADQQLVETLFNQVGKTLWVKTEDLLDSATSLSGCGPAIVFLIIEALQAAGKNLGLTAKETKLLTLQTMLGATKMALTSTHDVKELRRQVTSPGGVTEQAIATLTQGNLTKLFADTLTAAREKSGELAKTYGQKSK